MFQNTLVSHQIQFHNQTLRLESGLLAQQATACVTATIGQTVVMAAVVVGKPVPFDYFPLQVIYEERLYASGKIKGSRFIKREGRPSENAVLVGRMIDRSVRSLFNGNTRNELQVIVTVLSLDEVNPPDTLAVLAASAALSLCGIETFEGPVSSVRIGQAQTNAELTVNPNYSQTTNSVLDLVVSGDGKNIMMVEAGAFEVTEQQMGTCLDLANSELAVLTAFQQEFISLAAQAGLMKKTELTIVESDVRFSSYWQAFGADVEQALYFPGSKEIRAEKVSQLKKIHAGHTQLLVDFIKKNTISSIDELKEKLDVDPASVSFEIQAEIIKQLVETATDIADFSTLQKNIEAAFDGVTKKIVHANLLYKGKRLDGRNMNQVRPISSQIDVLPRTHGSSLFQRGETQVLNVLTLGTLRDALLQDDMEDFEETTKRYIHHYNFPSYSVGETGRYSGPGRREIGHGALAEKALVPVLPTEQEFPYTIRLVSECLGSNGSTSMASTCASTLSLLAAGVPIKKMIAGVAMGLVLNSDTGEFKVITDIQGAEDHYGDMDFKVTGSADGITAIQLDNKVAGLTVDILKQALVESLAGRLHILGKMQEVITQPRAEISEHAPHVTQFNIPFEKIGDVIGPSGKIIKHIIAETGVEIDIEDTTGKTTIYSNSKADIEKATKMILGIIKEYQVGEIVKGTVYRIEAYGAFVRFEDSQKDGMIHISKLSDKRVNKVEDVVSLGQVVSVKINEVNERGQVSLALVGE